MNGDLTPEERAALRTRIVAGARGITPAGAHRGAWIAGSIAAVLVVAIGGGVAATSMLNAAPVAETPSPTVSTVAPEPVTTPTPTPTPIPTPTPTPTASAARAPFDDSCENVLTSDQLTSLAGHPMSDVTFIPHDSRFTIRGGLFCDWASSDVYQAAQIVVAVLPAGQDLPEQEAESFAAPECPSDKTFCSFSRSDDAVQIHVLLRDRDRADQRAETAAAIADTVRIRFGDYPVGIPATPTDAWWSPWDCADLSSSIDAGAFGYDAVTTTDPGPETYTAPGTCQVTFTRSDGTLRSFVNMVPGGAVGLDAMASAAYTSELVSVAGATEAYWVEIQSKYDGAGGRNLWVTDGVNLLEVGAVVPPTVSNTLDATPDLSILLAEQLLPSL